MFSKSNWFSKMGCTRLAIAMGVGALCWGASAASASVVTVITMNPQTLPAPSDDIVVINTGTSESLQAGLGYTANYPTDTTDGVTVDGPTVAGVPLSVLQPDGSTDYNYSTLVLAGLNATGPAVPSPNFPAPGITTITEPLGTNAWFKLYSGPSQGGPGSVTLLSAVVSSAALVVEESGGSAVSTVLSINFTYTGGALYPALQALGYTPNPGDMSLELTGLTSVPTIAGDGQLTSFGGAATGSLDATTPEPGCMALAAMGILPLLRRRARNS